MIEQIYDKLKNFRLDDPHKISVCSPLIFPTSVLRSFVFLSEPSPESIIGDPARQFRGNRTVWKLSLFFGPWEHRFRPKASPTRAGKCV